MAKRGRPIIKKTLFGTVRKWTWICSVCGKEYISRTQAHECEIKHNPKSERSKRLFDWLQKRSGGYFATG